MSFLFWKQWKLNHFLCGATDTPVSDFWWRLLWVSKPEWVLPYSSLVEAYMLHYMFPEIHLWCDTCRPLGSQHGSQAVSSTYLWGIGGTRNRELSNRLLCIYSMNKVVNKSYMNRICTCFIMTVCKKVQIIKSITNTRDCSVKCFFLEITAHETQWHAQGESYLSF